jgi:hypothetical protein
MFDEVAVLRSGAETTLTTATLTGVSRDRSSLDVTTVSDRDRNVLIRDEILD